MDCIVHWGCKQWDTTEQLSLSLYLVLFYFFCSIAVISIILSAYFSTLLPVILLLIPSSEFFIPVIVLFITNYSLALLSLC